MSEITHLQVPSDKQNAGLFGRKGGEEYLITELNSQIAVAKRQPMDNTHLTRNCSTFKREKHGGGERNWR